MIDETRLGESDDGRKAESVEVQRTGSTVCENRLWMQMSGEVEQGRVGLCVCVCV